MKILTDINCMFAVFFLYVLYACLTFSLAFNGRIFYSEGPLVHNNGLSVHYRCDKLNMGSFCPTLSAKWSFYAIKSERTQPTIG
jgi:hypothetical protein